MKSVLGVLGYLLVVIGAVFIDAPIIALLAIPVYLAGAIMLSISFYKIFTGNKNVGLLGILIMLIILGYTAIQFNQVLVEFSRHELKVPDSVGWTRAGIIVLLYALASYLIYLGIEKNKKRSRYRSQKDWLFFAMGLFPLTFIIMLVMYWTGFWYGG